MGNKPTRSAAEIQTERQRWVLMSLEDKQRFFAGFSAVPLRMIATWSEYYIQRIPHKDRITTRDCTFSCDAELNGKVAIWYGDITHLLVDAVVNSGAKLDKGGQVNKAIMEQAGEYFLQECYSKGIPEPGKVLITGGYRMPAKYVINTVAPADKDKVVLQNCYTNSLEAAKENNLRTLAFPCIGTKKRDSFKLDKAARLVLAPIREWLQNNHQKHIDRVIFCVYSKDDLARYEQVMQEFFPISQEELSGAATGAATGAVPQDQPPKYEERPRGPRRPAPMKAADGSNDKKEGSAGIPPEGKSNVANINISFN